MQVNCITSLFQHNAYLLHFMDNMVLTDRTVQYSSNGCTVPHTVMAAISSTISFWLYERISALSGFWRVSVSTSARTHFFVFLPESLLVHNAVMW